MRKTWIGGLLFLGYYIVFLLGLCVTAPGYIERVWNLEALLGVEMVGMPVEELLIALGFGLFWSEVYEHYTWRRSTRNQALESLNAKGFWDQGL